MELQAGSDFENRAATVMWTNYITVTGGYLQQPYKAGSCGNEIESIYVRNSNGTLGTVITQGTTAGERTFTYDPATGALAF